jgi:hypothetical protein
MQKKLASILFSTRLTGFLFITYAVSMIVGTFMDRGMETSPTPYSRYWVYDSWWFSAIHIFFVINFIGNVFRFKLLRKEKITTLIFHCSFILILIGAGITRYISYEGVMPITEGSSENTFLSEKVYLEVFIDGERNGQPMRRTVEKKLLMSSRLNNNFTWNTSYNQTDDTETDIQIKFNNFIGGAEDGFVEDENGKWHLKLVETDGEKRHEHFLVSGEVANVHNVLYAFNKPTDGAINIIYDGEDYTVKTPFEGNVTVMATQTASEVYKDSLQPLQLRALYNLKGILFVIPEPAVKGRTGIVAKEVKQKNDQNALFVDVTIGEETQTVGLLGGKGWSNDKKLVEFEDFKVYLSYGSKDYPLPFALKLNDFIAERYPGTENSFASFKSKLTVEDEEVFDYDIYMNHVLDHKGFRFFQASFEPDEKTTILSVSHDFWGTWVTYIGYFLLYLGLMLILFDKGSRFGDLKRTLDKIKAKKAKLSLILLLFAFAKAETTIAQEINTSAVVVQDSIANITEAVEDVIGLQGDEQGHMSAPEKAVLDSIIIANAIPVEHASKFGRMVIQDDGGRMMPINTYSSLLLRKLTRRDTYAGLNADQVMLSMMENPQLWFWADLMYLKKGNDSIRNIIGVPDDVTRFKLMDFITPELTNKLDPFIAEAYREATPTVIDKEFRDIHQRLALLNRALSGSILKIFPKPNDVNNTWMSYAELGESNYKGMDSLYSKQIIPLYLGKLQEARQTGDFSKADELLFSIGKFQERFGADIMPSAEKIDAEIHYNKHDPFKKLYWM